MKHIGILGGTFNPIHNGHLILAETARAQFNLDEIWFIPSGCSYMKDTSKILPGNVRMEMTRLAIRENPHFKVSDVELKREGNTYTCETLSQLHEMYPDTCFYFIVGADTLYNMENWKNPEQIFSQAVILAAVRDDADMQDLQKQAAYLQQKSGGDIRFLHSLQIGISSTLIRENCKNGISNRYLIPESVRTLLETRGYYKE
ncbi:MAG: nicotinate-nucleotide adenylyltransferase [Lachnospiraceae bacterium]|nr:nicotinate-nucleotide adenylyltransferase [Lachnospiraceae bacterium]